MNQNVAPPAPDVSAVALPNLPPLPKINWEVTGRSAPKILDCPGDALPKADIVVVTWTTQEWSALDYVFLTSDTPRACSSPNTWKEKWKAFVNNDPEYVSDPIGGPLWGSYQLVEIIDLKNRPRRVLLFKANAHLTYTPFIGGLRAMTEKLLTDASPSLLYSIGTAGAARLAQQLGDAVVTNAACLQASVPQNAYDISNYATFTSDYFPNLEFVNRALPLMVQLDPFATCDDLALLLAAAKANPKNYPPAEISLTDLLNGALTKLIAPKVHSMRGIPINTSDNYGMAPGRGLDPFSVYEEDDAVLLEVALRRRVGYASIRNISDTVIPEITSKGVILSDAFRSAWAGAVDSRYAFYTAVNGAIATWAAIVGG